MENPYAFLKGEDICISDVAVNTGIRTAGYTVELLDVGRRYNGLLFIRQGAVLASPVDSQPITGEAGQLLLIPRGLRYRLQYTAEETSFTVINFELFTPSGGPFPLSSQPRLLMERIQDTKAQWLIDQLELCNSGGSDADLFRRKGYFFLLLSEIFDTGLPLLSPLQKPKFYGIIPGVRVLQQQYSENIPIPDLARLCSMSVSSFRELFAAQYGLSPIQYRNQLRIKRARYLLGMGGYTVSEAAAAVGFRNLGYFYRCYKKITGENPGSLLNDS